MGQFKYYRLLSILLNIYFINFMQSRTVQGSRVEIEALQKYIRTQFSDYDIPSVEAFLNLKKHNISEIHPFTFIAGTHNELPAHVTQMLEGENILYLQAGTIELHKRQARGWRREIEYKQGNFFTLINYKNLSQAEPEWFKLVFSSKVALSVMPISQHYKYDWMRAASMKNSLLSKVFLYSDSQIDIERKKHKFHEFIGHFKHQIFRRDTRFVHQGSKNQKVYIIYKGEAKLTKHLRSNKNGKEINKNAQILFVREGAVLGAELFLISSRAVHSIITSHTAGRGTSSLSIREEEHEESGAEEEEGRKAKKRSKSKLSKVSVESGGYELHDPHENVSNYTVHAQSANLEVFYIELDTLVAIISERYKINFLKLVESTYITILRRTHEKMVLELRKEEERVAAYSSKIQAMASRAYSSHNQSEMSQNQAITLKISQIGVSKSTLSPFKNEHVLKAQDNQLSRRSDLLSKEKKPVIDFKHKIQSLIESQLSQNPNTNQLIEDLADIFMKKNEGRSEDIEKRADFLERKRMILEKRGGWKEGWDQLKQDGVTAPQRKRQIEQKNYLRGVQVESLAFKIKEQCSHRIHQTNKIKEQFMKIKSECPSCMCYQNFEHFSTTRRNMTCMGRTGSKTSEGWGRTSKAPVEEESLETVYHRMTFVSEKTKEKYNHNIHLLKVRRNRSQLERRKSTAKI